MDLIFITVVLSQIILIFNLVNKNKNIYITKYLALRKKLLPPVPRSVTLSHLSFYTSSLSLLVRHFLVHLLLTPTALRSKQVDYSTLSTIWSCKTFTYIAHVMAQLAEPIHVATLLT